MLRLLSVSERGYADKSWKLRTGHIERGLLSDNGNAALPLRATSDTLHSGWGAGRRDATGTVLELQATSAATRSHGSVTRS